nr:unknown [Trichomonas vaginalis]
MTGYLPWRQRASLRTTICRLLRKQAISEYDNIRADPIAIQKDNEDLINNPEKLKESGYILKGGLLVSTKWDRTNSEWERVRKENTQKYEISKEEAETINIPSVISVDYMRQQCFRRRQSLLLYRAALLAEIARREGREPDNLNVDELQIRSGCDVVIPKAKTTLESDPAINDIFYTPEYD